MKLLSHPQIKLLIKRIIDNAAEVERHNAAGEGQKKTPLHFKIISVTTGGKNCALSLDRISGQEAFEKQLKDIEEIYPEASGLVIEIFASKKAIGGEQIEIVSTEEKPAEQKPADSPPALSGTQNIPAIQNTTDLQQMLQQVKFEQEKNNLINHYEREGEKNERRHERELNALRNKINTLEGQIGDLEEEKENLQGALSGPDGPNSTGKIMGEVAAVVAKRLLISPGGKSLMKGVGMNDETIKEVVHGFLSEGQEAPRQIPEVSSSFEFPDDNNPRNKQVKEISDFLKALDDTQYTIVVSLIQAACDPKTGQYMPEIAPHVAKAAYAKLEEIFTQKNTPPNA